MIIALLSDIHSNLDALDACLTHASENGADRYAFLGDIVGYGADPQGTVDKIRSYVPSGAIVVKGNHDDAVETHARYMNDAAKDSIDWTRKTLSPESKAFLSSLPLVLHEGLMCFVHASAASPERWDYVDAPNAARNSADAAKATYTFSGHVHEQMLYFEISAGKWSAFQPTPGSPIPISSRRRWLALVGSVGQPRDGNPSAAYTLFDPVSEQITFHRVIYDHLAAARKIRQAGLPELHAYRLERGA